MTEKPSISSTVTATGSVREKTSPPPDLQTFLLDTPLYSKEKFDNKRDAAWAHSVIYANQQIDAYCIYCKKETPFSTNPTYQKSFQGTAPFGLFSLSFTCKRNNNHHYTYEINFLSESVEKYGQYPSLEDIISVGISKYKSILPNADFSELRRATGLAAHGIGIGAFVYLRRIFERLIEEHRISYEKDNGPIVDYYKLCMEEKIQALSSTLPQSLVKNRQTYGILSKGLHELTEDECRLYFPVVLTAIIRILDDDLQNKERKKEEQELERQIKSIHATLSKS